MCLDAGGGGHLFSPKQTGRSFHTVVIDYINTMKTNFDLNFGVNGAAKQHGYSSK